MTLQNPVEDLNNITMKEAKKSYLQLLKSTAFYVCLEDFKFSINSNVFGTSCFLLIYVLPGITIIRYITKIIYPYMYNINEIVFLFCLPTIMYMERRLHADLMYMSTPSATVYTHAGVRWDTRCGTAWYTPNSDIRKIQQRPQPHMPLHSRSFFYN